MQLQTTRRKSSSLPKKVPGAHARVCDTAATTCPMTCSSQVKTDMAVKVPRKTRSLLTPPYWSSSYFPSHYPHFFINCNFSNFIFSTIRTALSETLDHSLCDFRVGISIGREKGKLEDKWFLITHNIFHNGHAPEESGSLRKPKRIRSQFEDQLAIDVMSSYGGSGVASSLYYYRTGEVLDRHILHRITQINHQAVMTSGSAAQSLIDDLRSTPHMPHFCGCTTLTYYAITNYSNIR